MPIIVKVVLSLLLVIALMYIILKVVQKYSKFSFRINAGVSGVKIAGILYIDENTKIVSLQRAQTNYILAVNKTNITVIDKYESDK